MQYSSYFCGNIGQQEMKAAMMGEMYNPEYNFNLISITKDCTVDGCYPEMMRTFCLQKDTRKSMLIQ